MAMNYPERPTADGWQFLGQALQQGGDVVQKLNGDLQEQHRNSNLLADMVDARIARKKEQERADWEFAQKKDKDAKEEAARKEINDLLQNGVKVPGVTTIIPPKTESVPGPWAPGPKTPSAPYDVPEAMGLPTMPVTTPGSTETIPDSYRPAAMADYQRAALPTEDPAAFVKNLVPPNKSAALTAVKTFILQAKAAGNKMIKSSDLDAAALAGDPTGAILTDKDYNAFKKTYATDVQTQNADSTAEKNGILQQNANTANRRANIAQQNADSYSKKVANNQSVDLSNPDNVEMVAQDLASGAIRLEKLPFLLGRGAQNSGARLAAYQRAKQINPDFNPSEYEKEFDAYKNNGNQKALAQIAAVRPNIDTIIKMSADVPRMGMPAINKMIMNGRYAIGDTPVTTLQEMQHALADELGTALSRSGNFSDAKLALARDLLHTDVSEGNFASNMELLKYMLDNNEKSIRAPMGHYGDGGHKTPAASPAATADAGWTDDKERRYQELKAKQAAGHL